MFSNGPVHWKTEQNGGHFYQPLENQTLLEIPNMFGIPAPTVLWFVEVSNA